MAKGNTQRLPTTPDSFNSVEEVQQYLAQLTRILELNITSLDEVEEGERGQVDTGLLTIEEGGTGASTSEDARENLGTGIVDSIEAEDDTINIAGTPENPTIAVNTDEVSTKEYVDSELSSRPFYPIGHPFPVWDHLTGVDVPNNDGQYKYIKLTFGENGAGEFNEGLTINETQQGSEPENIAQAEIATGPMQGVTVYLLNSMNVFLRAGETSGELEFDQMQKITGSFVGPREGVSTNNYLKGAFTYSGDNNTGDLLYSGDSDRRQLGVDFDSADSPNARTSSDTNGETRPKNVKVTYYMRII